MEKMWSEKVGQFENRPKGKIFIKAVLNFCIIKVTKIKKIQ